MGIGNIHTIGAIVVSGSPAFNLDGIEQASIDPAVALTIQNAGGQVDPSYVAVMSQSPTVTFTCTDIATALANAGISGLAIASTGATSIDLFFTKAAQGSTRTSGSTHGRVRAVEGILVPQTLSARQDQHTTIQYRFVATYDGTNNPFTFTFSQALPHTPSVDELFTVGKVSINGTELDGVVGIDIDFGIELIVERSGGDVYPTYVAIGQRRPKIEIATKEIPSLSTFGLSGTAQTSTDSVIYLQKVSENATRVAAATAEHISLTIDDGIIHCGEYGGSNNVSAEGRVVIQPTWDGTNAIMVINTATAIS